MKKLVNLLTILTMASCFTLVACGDDDDNANPGPQGGAATGGHATAGQTGGGQGGAGGVH